jgi:hypothetical protein
MGIATHIALLTVTGKKGSQLSQKQQETAVDHLGEVIRSSLRRCDAASRCSISQYVIMLPQANYENSCMVCRRIISAFNRQYPHSPARIDYAVEAMEPNI